MAGGIILGVAAFVWIAGALLLIEAVRSRSPARGRALAIEYAQAVFWPVALVLLAMAAIVDFLWRGPTLRERFDAILADELGPEPCSDFDDLPPGRRPVRDLRDGGAL